MAESRVQRRLAAILAADVVGYSRLMEVDEAGTLATLKARRKDVLVPLVAKHQGRVFKIAGDSVLVEFGSAVNAIACAVELQEAFAAANADMPDDRRIILRIGVNLGDIMAEGSDLYGDGINIAARLEALAEPGGILISGTAHDYVRNKVKVGFEDLGGQALKNIAEPVRAYRVAGTPGVAPPPPKAASDKPSLAVLPFNNMSGDPEQEYFSDGITEDIITELSRSRSLFVIARNSSFAFKGRAVDVSEVGRKLGVGYVVEGSVRKVGTRVRITAQLIEASSGNHVWAERYDRDLEDIFAVQDEVTERIVWALAGRVAVAEIGRSKQRRKEQLDAYDLMLRGIEAYHRYTRESCASAVQLFKQAVAADPVSARAHAWLADCHWIVSVFESDPAMKELSFQAAKRAAELGDSDGHAESALAVYHWYRKDFDAAEASLQRAAALGPNNPDTQQLLGYVRLWQGQTTEAIAIGERLRKLDPMKPGWIHELLAYALYLRGDYALSLESFRNWNNMDLHRAFANLAACLAQLGRTDEAVAAWRRCLEAKPDFTIAEYREGSPYRRPEDLEHWLDGLRKAGVTE